MSGGLDLAGHVVIVTGPPGAGKTTVAGRIAADAACPAVHLQADDFWRFIKRGHVSPYRPEAHAQNTVVIAALRGAAAAYAEGGYLVVLEGIVGPWFLPPFRDLAAPLHYAVLRPPLEVVLARVRGRRADVPLGSGPVVSLHQQFSRLEALEHHVLDTGGQTPAQTQALLCAALAASRLRLS